MPTVRTSENMTSCRDTHGKIDLGHWVTTILGSIEGGVMQVTK